MSWSFNPFTGTFDKVGSGGGGGGVSSVGLVLPTEFTVTVSPITTSGSLTAIWKVEPANTVFAGPTSGAPATPAFRALVSADIAGLAAPGHVLFGPSHTDMADLTPGGPAPGTIPYFDATITGKWQPLLAIDNGSLIVFDGPNATPVWLAPDATTGSDIDTVSINGPGTGINIALSTTGVTAATYGDGTHVGQFTVDAKGRLTFAGNVAITGAAPTGAAGGDLSGTYPNPTVSKINGVAYNADPLTQYVAIAGRPGAGNDFIITSTGTKGIITGSTVVAGGMVLKSTSAGATADGSIWAEVGDTRGFLISKGAVVSAPNAGLQMCVDATHGMDLTALIENHGDTTTDAPTLYFRRSRGTNHASPTAVLTGNDLTRVHTQGYDGSTYADGAKLAITAGENWSGSAHGVAVALQTVVNGATTLADRITISTAGVVAIPSLVHSTISGLTTGDAGHTQFLLLAGRTSTTNNPTISTDADGTLYGSATSTKGLTLQGNSANAANGPMAFKASSVSLVNASTKPILAWNDGVHSISFQQGSQSANLAFTLPTADAAGVLTSDGAGTLSFGTGSGLAIAGDVTGTLGATTVVKINGVAYNADPLVQYTKLAGRTGATNDTTLSTTITGNLYGSSASGVGLTLNATSHATKGDITAADRVVLASGSTQQALIYNPSVTVTSTIIKEPVSVQGTFTLNASQALVLRSLGTANQITVNATAAALSGFLGVELRDVVTIPAVVTSQAYAGFQNESRIDGNAGSGNIATIAGLSSFNDFSALNAVSGTLAVVNDLTTVASDPTLTAAASSFVTVTNRRALWVQNIGSGGAGTCTITNNYGVYVDDMSLGTTLKRSLHSVGTAVLMTHAGGARFGDTTAPTEKLESAANAAVSGIVYALDSLGSISTSKTGFVLRQNATFTADLAIRVLDISGTWTYSVDPSINNFGLYAHQKITGDGGGTFDILGSWKSVEHEVVYEATVANTIVLADQAVVHAPTFQRTGAGTFGASTMTAMVSAPTVSTGCTVATRLGYDHAVPAGAGTVTSDIALRSALLSSTTNNYSVKDTGGAPSLWIGSQMQLYSPTSQTIPTENFVIHGGPLKLTGTQSFTLVGTSLLVLLGN